MDWYEFTDRYHGQTLKGDGDLSLLREDWQRELAALWRLEADVNNGGYLQFIENWGVDTVRYAIIGLRKINATEMSKIVEECQKLVEQHVNGSIPESERYRNLMPNPILNSDGTVTTPPPSPVPEDVQEKIDELSYQFMAYPEDVASLGVAYYSSRVESDS